MDAVIPFDGIYNSIYNVATKKIIEEYPVRYAHSKALIKQLITRAGFIFFSKIYEYRQKTYTMLLT